MCTSVMIMFCRCSKSFSVKAVTDPEESRALLPVLVT